MKQIKLSRLLIAVATLTIIIVACKKKELLKNNSNETAQEWYQKTMATSVSTMKSNTNKSIAVKQMPDWDKG